MSAQTEKPDESQAEKLLDFEQRLVGPVDDDGMLKGVHTAISSLLTDSGANAESIQAILKRRFEAGELREETYELVQEMLDRVLNESEATLPGSPGEKEIEAALDNGDFDDVFTETAVIAVPDSKPQEKSDHPQVGTVLRDRFLLKEQLAGGSMGVVFKALDRRLAEADEDDPYVAIKVVAPKLAKNVNALRALQQEAAKGRCLTHPNIVRFVDLDRDDDLYFIVMEWLDGRSLANILDESRTRGIEPAAALDIVRQVGQALDYAHRCGVIHADVKPGNIMITPEGQAKLFDFGVARVRQKEQEGKRAFDPGVLNARTLAYSSMQVITGEEPVPADDVFSLACLMYRLIAGHRVFGPRNAAEAAAEGMEPQRPAGLSQTQWAALRKALSYSRVTRFPSPQEFLDALDGAKITQQPAPVAVETRVEPEPQRTSPWRAVALALIAVALVAVVGQEQIIRLLPPGWQDYIPTGLQTQPPSSEPDASPFSEPDAAMESSQLPQTHAGDEDLLAEDLVEELAVEEIPAYVPVDFDSLPPPALLLVLPAPGQAGSEASLVLREDTEETIVDLLREDDIGTPLSLRFEEISFSGNRSPWEARQYQISNDGVVEFVPGQARARMAISMSSDPLREPDRQVSLLLRDVDSADSKYATINLELEDDDQRTFEAELRPNTVAFAVSQVSVREQDPAVQIDVLRFKADSSVLDVQYFVRDVTATEGEDYFATSSNTVSFGPGQRTARILIPLVQDTEPETDEAFMLELAADELDYDRDIYLRIAVMIRDDDL